jgi:hypothetical protein
MASITPQSTQEEIKQFVERAKQIYFDQLAAKLEPAHNGEIVAIDPETGDYFLGEDEVQAADRGRAAGHEGPFFSYAGWFTLRAQIEITSTLISSV